MQNRQFKTVNELLFWSYANLAMAHSAVKRGQNKYLPYNYMIRAKLFKGLLCGSMNIGSIFDDEKIKLFSGCKCSYCGSSENLSLDHVFPKKKSGCDDANNLIYACKNCNSSKGDKDLMEWMTWKNEFPPLLVLRRYLKLIIAYCVENNLMDLDLDTMKELDLPFKLDKIPVKYPEPSYLILERE